MLLKKFHKLFTSNLVYAIVQPIQPIKKGSEIGVQAQQNADNMRATGVPILQAPADILP